MKILRGNPASVVSSLRELIIEKSTDWKSYPYAVEVPLQGFNRVSTFFR